MDEISKNFARCINDNKSRWLKIEECVNAKLKQTKILFRSNFPQNTSTAKELELIKEPLKLINEMIELNNVVDDVKITVENISYNSDTNKYIAHNVKAKSSLVDFTCDSMVYSPSLDPFHKVDCAKILTINNLDGDRKTSLFSLCLNGLSKIENKLKMKKISKDLQNSESWSNLLN